MRLAPITSLVCATALLMAAAGCEGDSSQVAGIDASVLSTGGMQSSSQLSVKGSLTGTTLGIPEDPSVACPPPTGAPSPQASQLTGLLTNLRMTTLTSTVCQTVTGFAFPSVFIRGFDGIGTIETAKGDKIFGTNEFEGAINLNCSALSTFEGVFTITGGTGRFAGATGTVPWTGTQVPAACPPGFNPPPFTLEVHLDGMFELPR